MQTSNKLCRAFEHLNKLNVIKNTFFSSNNYIKTWRWWWWLKTHLDNYLFSIFSLSFPFLNNVTIILPIFAWNVKKNLMSKHFKCQVKNEASIFHSVRIQTVLQILFPIWIELWFFREAVLQILRKTDCDTFLDNIHLDLNHLLSPKANFLWLVPSGMQLMYVEEGSGRPWRQTCCHSQYQVMKRKTAQVLLDQSLICRYIYNAWSKQWLVWPSLEMFNKAKQSKKILDPFWPLLPFFLLSIVTYWR